MTDREFDLNIEKILDSWEVYHAVREIIANALDEQILTGTADISIFKDESERWHIVDYGRGLNYHHLTQNENEEKLKNEHLIGRFGVGLKDALATLYRHDVKVRISSKFGVITLKQATKAGFNDIMTLHANIADPDNADMVGTDVCLEGCDDDSIDKAKALFLKFSDAQILEETSYGSVIERKHPVADIFINGVKVAEEPNFLFSYNITNLNTKIRKALNRERSNVGRTAYTDRVKAILQECTSYGVISKLVGDLQSYGSGDSHDEMKWQEVQFYACDQLRKSNEKVTFVTTDDLANNRSTIDNMERSGFQTVVIPDNVQRKIDDYNSGVDDSRKITTTYQYIEKSNADFVPKIIDPSDFTDEERKVYDKTDAILATIGGKPKNVRTIEIAEKLYDVGYGLGGATIGLWRDFEGRILIKRSQLESLADYAGTLLHECAHATSGCGDVDREFELALTDTIGILAAKLLS